VLGTGSSGQLGLVVLGFQRSNNRVSSELSTHRWVNLTRLVLGSRGKLGGVIRVVGCVLPGEGGFGFGLGTWCTACRAFARSSVNTQGKGRDDGRQKGRDPPQAPIVACRSGLPEARTELPTSSHLLTVCRALLPLPSNRVALCEARSELAAAGDSFVKLEAIHRSGHAHGSRSGRR
jgi:hypothetical protein